MLDLHNEKDYVPSSTKLKIIGATGLLKVLFLKIWGEKLKIQNFVRACNFQLRRTLYIIFLLRIKYNKKGYV